MYKVLKENIVYNITFFFTSIQLQSVYFSKNNPNGRHIQLDMQLFLSLYVNIAQCADIIN